MSALVAHAVVLHMLPRHYGLFEFHVVVGFLTVGVLVWWTGNTGISVGSGNSSIHKCLLGITHWMTLKEYEFSDYKIDVICTF